MDYIWTGGGLHKDPWGSVRYSRYTAIYTSYHLFSCTAELTFVSNVGPY
jgi:hypothetical protein